MVEHRSLGDPSILRDARKRSAGIALISDQVDRGVDQLAPSCSFCQRQLAPRPITARFISCHAQ